MPVRTISEHCLQIRRWNMMNCYLVREDDGLTLVDTSLFAARIIMEAARHLGQPIRRILLTHAHVDHVGSIAGIKKAAPDAQIVIGERESKLLAEAARGVKPGQMALLPGEPQTPVKGSFSKVSHTPDRLLGEGDRVGSLRAVNTPGHTPGHFAFLDERDGTLYAGDALLTFGGLRLPFNTPWYFPLPKAATWHFPSALASGRKIAALSPARVLPGHGPALESPPPLFQSTLERAERVLAGQS